jgi:hypothetical protein
MALDLTWGSLDEQFPMPYFCPTGHDFTHPMTIVEAAAVTVVPCPVCDLDASSTPPGESADLVDLRERPEHWEQVRARRTPQQLDDLLDWALRQVQVVAAA